MSKHDLEAAAFFTQHEGRRMFGKTVWRDLMRAQWVQPITSKRDKLGRRRLILFDGNQVRLARSKLASGEYPTEA
jgi:hypothetical protein